MARIEDLKRWHWLVIGVAVGVGISLWRGSIDAETALAGRSTLDVGEFERLLTRQTRSGQPMLKNIQVYPVGDGVYWLSAEQLRTRGGRRWGGGGGDDDEQQYVPVKIRATTPFVPRANASSPNADPNGTIVDYLASLKASNPNVDYASRWWDVEPMRTALFAAAGAMLIGGVWPSLINLLIGAGYGKRSEKKEPEYDLSRFGQGMEESPAMRKPAATTEDLAKLRALEAELEKNIAGGAAGTTAPTSDPPASSERRVESPVRKLTGGPVELAVPEQPKEEKHYAGEYYPTVTHVKRH